MKILMFINPALNLVQPVVDELISQGHKVNVINDFFEYYDPKDVERRGRLNDRKIEIWNNSVTAYWKRHEDIIAQKYDMFISFTAWRINHTAFELIDKYSPGCVKVQYTWESFNHLDLKMIEGYFDRLLTFDILDARNPGWQLLPSFYSDKYNNAENVVSDYDLFMIGSNHDRRYSFVRKVLRSLKSENLNNFIRIYPFPSGNVVVNFAIDCVKTMLDLRNYHELLFKYGYENKELRITQQIDPDEYAEIMKRSKCILDDNYPLQSGLSPRFNWAMALNKKVITTNKWAYDYSYVNRDNVLIVDKDNPVIDPDFLKSEPHPPIQSNLGALELSNWVKILIGEVECPTFEKA